MAFDRCCLFFCAVLDHLNLAGAKKVTSDIGGYLDKMYSLPDRRSDPMYQEWADCYAESAHAMD